MSKKPTRLTLFEALAIALGVLVAGGGLWRMADDDVAQISRDAIAALQDDSRKVPFGGAKLPETLRVWAASDVSAATRPARD